MFGQGFRSLRCLVKTPHVPHVRLPNLRFAASHRRVRVFHCFSISDLPAHALVTMSVDVRPPPSPESKETGYGYKSDDIAPAAHGGAVDLFVVGRRARLTLQ